jgi:hypothetical protein
LRSCPSPSREPGILDLSEAWFSALAEGRPADTTARIRTEAGLPHAVDYATWQSLTTEALSDEEAADAMSAFDLMATRSTRAAL